MSDVVEEPAVADEVLEALAEGARAAGELHLDAALVELRVELTADLLTRLKAACAAAGSQVGQLAGGDGAGLDALGDRDLLRRVEQRDQTDLAEVEPDRVAAATGGRLDRLQVPGRHPAATGAGDLVRGR